jgi:hypothetical protein
LYYIKQITTSHLITIQVCICFARQFRHAFWAGPLLLCVNTMNALTNNTLLFTGDWQTCTKQFNIFVRRWQTRYSLLVVYWCHRVYKTLEVTDQSDHAISKAICWLLTVMAQLQSQGNPHSTGAGLSTSTSVCPCPSSVHHSILIYHQGWYNMPICNHQYQGTQYKNSTKLVTSRTNNVTCVGLHIAQILYRPPTPFLLNLELGLSLLYSSQSIFHHVQTLLSPKSGTDHFWNKYNITDTIIIFLEALVLTLYIILSSTFSY